jgi:hypothetical protein
VLLEEFLRLMQQTASWEPIKNVLEGAVKMISYQYLAFYKY